MIRALFKKMMRLTWKALPQKARNLLIRTCMSGMTDREKFRAGFPTMPGFLKSIGEMGFSPVTIIDVGANVGGWARMASRLFPSSRILMFEADADNEQALRDTLREIGNRSEYLIALLGPEKKDAVTFYKLGFGSSVLPELTTFEKQVVALPMNTLDNVVQGAALQPPLLLKLDVQGFELEVLRGGRRTLGLAEVVITEVSLLPYNAGAPLFAEVVAFMSEEGFVVFDFCGQLRREIDGVLFQTDVVFVRRDSPLLAPRKFWLSEP
jgi:FkbM family methyltransferase